MPTATTSKPRKPARTKPADVCRLTLHIRGEAYSVRILDADQGADVSRLIRLKKADGTTYDIAQTRHGATCDCADHTFRHEGRDAQGCKHARALRAVGLIDR